MYRLKTGYSVGDCMTMNPVTISSKKNLREAAKLMAAEHVGSLLVKEDDKIVGIITEKDITRKGVGQSGNPATKKVSDIMAQNLVTCSPDEDIFEALRVMRDYDFRHLPVFHNGKCVGLITMKDILKIEPDLYEILVEKISLREMERKPVK